MEQKNTIVKCKAHPNCLFNHNGICDNYVINIGVDGKCESYVETENEYDSLSAQEILEYTIELEREKIKRGQRAKGKFYDDATFNLCSAACHNYDFKGASLYCQLRQEYLGPERLMKPCDLFVKAENDKVAVKMKIAELNKPNKNKSTIKIPSMPKEDREIMNDIGYVPSTYPNYDECWICVHGGNSNTYCNLSAIPLIGPDGKCCRFSRRVE